MPKVTKLKVTLQKGSNNTVFATWAFENYAKELEHYVVTWSYYTGNKKVWFVGGSSNVKVKQATYSVPSNAISVKVAVKPVSKKHKVEVNNPAYKGGNNKHLINTPRYKIVQRSYWKGVSVSKTYKMPSTTSVTPEKPSAPTVTVNKYKLTATYDTQDKLVDKIEFYIINGNKKFKSGTVSLNKTSRRASYSCDISAGSKYRVRCRAIHVVGKKNIYSGWSEYSGEVYTAPPVVKGLKCAVDSKTSIKLSWTWSTSSTSYEVEYTKNKSYFSSSSEVSSTTTEKSYAYVTGLEPGERYYFRVKAINAQGESAWSGIVNTVLGSTPEAPTTWSSTTTVIVGESVTLYWIHNCEDGSAQTSAQIEYIIGSHYYGHFHDGIDKDKIGSCSLNLSNYKDGTEVLWHVRTQGITGDYGPYSIKRMIKIYAPATLSLTLGEPNKTESSESEEEIENIMTGFPYRIEAIAGPNSQKPVSYHISITSEETYRTDSDADDATEDEEGSDEVYDAVGLPMWVNAGEELYSKVFHTSENPLTLNLSAGDVYLKNNQPYKVTVTVSMDSGLTAEASDIFTVSWSDTSYEPDAGLAIFWDTLTASISPFCRDEEDNLVPNVTLGVYRREYDGSFTELDIGLPNDGSVTITDPHPALDYARYRITVRDENTGVISFEDLPGEPVLEPSIVIQWDEEWTSFDFSEDNPPENPPWTGSMIRIPWNVDIDESHEPDVSLVEYMGRKHPVSYYGTQRGETASWSVEIDKSDKETIYALRRLSAWAGDVYVREPSGIGYWAHVTVSMSINHCELTVPVSFTINRVEGGK